MKRKIVERHLSHLDIFSADQEPETFQTLINSMQAHLDGARSRLEQEEKLEVRPTGGYDGIDGFDFVAIGLESLISFEKRVSAELERKRREEEEKALKRDLKIRELETELKRLRGDK